MPSWKKLLVSGSDASLNTLTVSNGITGSLFGSASYALTASYALNGGGGGNVSGSNITGSFTTSSTWVFNHNLNNRFVIVQTYDSSYNQVIPQEISLTNDNTATIVFPTSESGYAIASIGGAINTVTSASYALTASYALNGGGGITPGGTNQQIQYNDGNVSLGGVPTLTYDGSVLRGTGIFSGSFTGSLMGTSSWAQLSSQAITSSYALTASYSVSASQALTASYSVSASYAVSASYSTTSSNANTSSLALNSELLGNSNKSVFATTGSNVFKDSQTITGSLTITQNLIVLGSSSVSYTTASQLLVDNNFIKANLNTPSIRFGGLSIIDSGSTNGASGSLVFDSLNNRWLFEYPAEVGSGTTSSILILGPQTYNNLGNESLLTTNKLLKSSTGNNIQDSNITDNGTVVSINSNTQITGSLQVSQGVSGSLFGTSSWAQSSSQAISASYTLTASYINTLNQNLEINGTLIVDTISGNVNVPAVALLNYYNFI